MLNDEELEKTLTASRKAGAVDVGYAGYAPDFNLSLFRPPAGGQMDLFW